VRIRTLIGLAVASAMALVLATPVSAQTPAQPPSPSDQPRASQQLSSPVEGVLVSVDADAKKITIKPASGAELVMAYTDTTQISGAQKDAAGLATMEDAQVTVHFTEDAQTKAKTATRIIVQPKK
jgi:Cu/Ag efflux protein CusF